MSTNTPNTKEEERYTKEEFFKMIESGEIKLSVPLITGRNGSKYSRDPSPYPSVKGKWSYTEFSYFNKTFLVATYEDDKGEVWYHLGALLLGVGLKINKEASTKDITKGIPYRMVRIYQLFGNGMGRTCINKEGLGQLGLSMDGKPNVKRKQNIEFSGIVTLNINIPAVESALMKIMDKLKTMEERAVLCDIHRILKQIQ